MGFGHVGGVGGVAATFVAAQVAGDAPPAQEDLDGARGEADVAALADVVVGNRVEVTVDLKVVVDVHLRGRPEREFVRRRRQGPQRLALDLLEQTEPGAGQFLERLAVELIDQLADGDVELAKREEDPVADDHVIDPGHDHVIDPPLGASILTSTRRFGARESRCNCSTSSTWSSTQAATSTRSSASSTGAGSASSA